MVTSEEIATPLGARVESIPQKPALPQLGYRVLSADNGGWTVFSAHHDQHRLELPLGAFTSGADLLAWLKDEHRKVDEGKAQRPGGDPA